MLMADLRRDYVQTLFERMDDLEMNELEEQFKSSKPKGARRYEIPAFPPIGSFSSAPPTCATSAKSMRSPCACRQVGREDARAEVKRRFDEAHDLRYSQARRRSPPISSACACRRSVD